ncbi:hypothetical protein OG921_00585 [Aldersonia sp. NBC_00410]|uniref:acyltransferase n=1 Tax=Aldersonia sp. NBC_00410 TaxID=2975954 RepID=UPI00225A8FDB|nr:hypothetical protein [Aldersonia sp. NBC_00410]MCX5041685.1 hypothetical protein [Aldersonia sp. NBC_00410]
MAKVLMALHAIVWLCPSGRWKNALLRRFGHAIGSGVTLAPTLVVGCGRFVLDDGVQIASFNVFRDMVAVVAHDNARIGSWNWFSAHPRYRNDSPGNGTFEIGRDSFVTSRHYFDCSGVVTIGELSAIGGQRSTFQTHELDLVANCETVGRIEVGDRGFVATGCILLRDSRLPSRSMLAAGSTLTRLDDTSDTPQGLWAGTPARFVKPMQGRWFDRNLDQVR